MTSLQSPGDQHQSGAAGTCGENTRLSTVYNDTCGPLRALEVGEYLSG